MKILIINLPRYQGLSVTREGRCEFVCNYRVDTPATLLIIASLLKAKDHIIEFMDTNAQKLNYSQIEIVLQKNKFECVIFTFNSWILEHDLRICKIVKSINPSCITIGYSRFAEAFGFEILTKFSDLDVQIVNDPFSVIEILIEAIDKNNRLSEIDGIAFRDTNDQIIINKNLSIKKSFSELPLPAYELIPSFKPYYLYSPLLKPYALIYAGKGCPFKCTYCPEANTGYSGKSAEQIIEELEILKHLGDIKYVWFYDEIFTINRERILKLCREINNRNLKIKWFCDSRVDLVDKKLLQDMKKAGCIGISYGVESGSTKILKSMKKGIKKVQILNALKWTRESSIPIQLNLLLGYIGENKDTLRDSEDLIRNILPEILQISIIIPFYGTEFTEISIKNNWLKDDVNWYQKLAGTILSNKYPPYTLDLFKEIKRMRKILYSNPKWWFNIIKTLIKNRQLIIPTLGMILKRSTSLGFFT